VRTNRALVLSVTRKYATIFVDETVLEARVSARVADLSAGDSVHFRHDSAGVIVDGLDARCSLLSRSYRGKSKVLAANIDKLFIVAAPPPLFQTEFIDRVLVAANVGKISSCLIINKTDIDYQAVLPCIRAYQDIGVTVLYTCALNKTGLSELFDLLARSASIRIVALCGISGVGKSSILNQLVPEAGRRTADVNLRGQGRQTTTQAVAYPCYGCKDETVFVVDLPGVQHFGLTALTKREAAQAFPEIAAAAAGCRYDDCMHLAEPECAVKDAVAGKKIADFRYASYCKIIAEIDSARPY
jgi:ribosome biogenesis GTPase